MRLSWGMRAREGIAGALPEALRKSLSRVRAGGAQGAPRKGLASRVRPAPEAPQQAELPLLRKAKSEVSKDAGSEVADLGKSGGGRAVSDAVQPHCKEAAWLRMIRCAAS